MINEIKSHVDTTIELTDIDTRRSLARSFARNLRQRCDFLFRAPVTQYHRLLSHIVVASILYGSISSFACLCCLQITETRISSARRVRFLVDDEKSWKADLLEFTFDILLPLSLSFSLSHSSDNHRQSDKYTHSRKATREQTAGSFSLSLSRSLASAANGSAEVREILA